jgi:F0F1-type ATP synthase assembly protein I
MNERRFDYTILGLIVGSLLGMGLGLTFFFARSTATVGLTVYAGALLGAGTGALLDRARHLDRPT